MSHESAPLLNRGLRTAHEDVRWSGQDRQPLAQAARRGEPRGETRAVDTEAIDKDAYEESSQETIILGDAGAGAGRTLPSEPIFR